MSSEKTKQRNLISCQAQTFDFFTRFDTPTGIHGGFAAFDRRIPIAVGSAHLIRFRMRTATGSVDVDRTRQSGNDVLHFNCSIAAARTSGQGRESENRVVSEDTSELES